MDAGLASAASAMNSFEVELGERLAAISADGLFRELRRVDSAQSRRVRIKGLELLNFSSNDYLGLANHPALKSAALAAVDRFGAGSGASRLISGSLAPFHDLEERLAAFKRTESALVFSSGYTAALGTVCSILGKEDVVVLDKKIHACFVDAARLCGAKLRVFAHNDLDELESILQWAGTRMQGDGPAPPEKRRCLIITESVFSMDGDFAPLEQIVALKEKHGAWLMVDEAHATGLYSKSGGGLSDELGLGDRIEIQMGTLGKALGASGGYICGSRQLTGYLVNRARPFIFSTAPTPASAATACAALEIVQSDEGDELRRKLFSRIREFEAAVGLEPRLRPSAIIPIILGPETAAVRASLDLREAGFFVPAIRFPAVARGEARLRLSLSAAHQEADITALAEQLKNLQVTHRA
jgi:8-amino-7-oxononanoate synthase